MNVFEGTSVPRKSMLKWELARHVDLPYKFLSSCIKEIEAELKDTVPGYERRQRRLFPVHIEIILIHLGYISPKEQKKSSDKVS
ncbi:MAG: hypothetical protein AAFR66_18935 [Bacteroidota bacterium]